jgi:hypothetical protein
MSLLNSTHEILKLVEQVSDRPVGFDLSKEYTEAAKMSLLER